MSHDILKYICDYLNMHCDNAYSNNHKYILICHVTINKRVNNKLSEKRL